MASINEIFKSRNIILELLNKQNYDVSGYQGSNLSEVNTMVDTEQMDMLLMKKNDSTTKTPPKKCYVKYHILKKSGKVISLGLVKIDNIMTYINDLMPLDENINDYQDDKKRENVLDKKDDLIIISKDEPNETLIKELKKLWEQNGIYVVVFSIKRLQFNILNHNLVPEHIILNKQEILEFKNKYKITNETQIPDINRFSPVALAIGMRPGDICKIVRNSRTAVNTEFYRVCV